MQHLSSRVRLGQWEGKRRVSLEMNIPIGHTPPPPPHPHPKFTVNFFLQRKIVHASHQECHERFHWRVQTELTIMVQSSTMKLHLSCLNHSSKVLMSYMVQELTHLKNMVNLKHPLHVKREIWITWITLQILCMRSNNINRWTFRNWHSWSMRTLTGLAQRKKMQLQMWKKCAMIVYTKRNKSLLPLSIQWYKGSHPSAQSHVTVDTVIHKLLYCFTYNVSCIWIWWKQHTAAICKSWTHIEAMFNSPDRIHTHLALSCGCSLAGW